MKQKWVIALLAVGVLGVATEYWILFSPTSPDGSVAETDAYIQDDEDLMAGEVEDSQAPLPIMRPQLASLRSSTPGLPRSPFLTRAQQNGLGTPGGSGLPRLSGTMIGSGRRVAWFNDRPRVEGEFIADFLVERIEATRALLRLGDEVFPLEVTEPLPDTVPEEMLE